MINDPRLEEGCVQYANPPFRDCIDYGRPLGSARNEFGVFMTFDVNRHFGEKLRARYAHLCTTGERGKQEEMKENK